MACSLQTKQQTTYVYFKENNQRVPKYYGTKFGQNRLKLKNLKKLRFLNSKIFLEFAVPAQVPVFFKSNYLQGVPT